MNRYLDLIILLCLSGAFCTGVIAYHKGVVAGRQESERLFASQVQGLDRMTYPTEIKALRSEGQK